MVTNEPVARGASGQHGALARLQADLGRARLGWLDVLLAGAFLLAATTDQLVLGVHVVFVLLTVAALHLGLRAFAWRAVLWCLAIFVLVYHAVAIGTTQSEELAELPLMASILAVVFLVARRRAVALRELQHAHELVQDYQTELEEQLGQAQRIAVLGRLTGGVAHDFSNVLTAIAGYAEDILDEPEGPPARFAAGEIMSVVERAVGHVADLMAFSRPEVGRAENVDVNAVVTSLCGLLTPLVGENIRLELRLADEPVVTPANPSRLERVVVNLALNARDAVADGGRITISTRLVTLTAAEAKRLALERAGRYACIAVADTGCGIEAGTLESIFEPHFTTKTRGTGFGLATVRSIVTDSRGAVVVESMLGVGTTFAIYLPATSVRAVEPDRSDSGGEAPEALVRGTGTVLVVEDDAQVRSRIHAALAVGGYDVLDAADGESALKIAAQHEGQLDLLVTDVVLPTIDGVELARQLQRFAPALRVLLLSGYSEDVLGPLMRGTRTQILPKPFTRRDLLQRAQQVLMQPNAASRTLSTSA